MTDTQPSGGLFWALTGPARVVSRFRPDLAASLRGDAATFDGPRRGIFVALALLTVGYPIIASIIHATLGPQQDSDTFSWAIAPYFQIVYSESLPFMLAVAAVAAFSPALGVLLMAVFIPADLVATAMAFPGGNQFQPPLNAVAARLLSYAILWILVVEIPLRARGWVARWRGLRSQPNPSVVAGRYAVAMGGLVFLWGSALWFLIQPVINWTSIAAYSGWRQFNATWTYGWILVLGVAMIAFVAALGRPAEAWEADANATREDRPPAGSIRQLARLAVIAALLSGLMWDWLDAILIVGGLIVAGPVLSWALPRLSAPTWVGSIPTEVRWLIAAVVAPGVTLLALALFPVSTLADDYGLVAVLLAVLLPLVRLVLEAGRAGPPSLGSGRRTPPVIATILSLTIVLVVSLAFPALALAEDEPARNPSNYPLAAMGLLFGAVFAFALATAQGDGVPSFNWGRDPQGDPEGRFDKVPIKQVDFSDLKGPCVLTTACVTALGKPDDCHELMMFRRLRDEYLSRNPEGIAVIENYYRTAPIVVAAIQAGADPDNAWRAIFGEWVEPVVGLVDAGQIDDAVELALSRYEAIKRQYGVQ